MQEVRRNLFVSVYRDARRYNELIRNNTSVEVPFDAKFYLGFTRDVKAYGFVISDSGELTNVFSETKCMGDYLLKRARLLGASRLDCFDGYLVDFYKRHGFEECRREKNWTDGQPDVVFMEIEND